MRYVLTGGGTGGHVYPNLAIASQLARHDPLAEFLYLGVAGRAEADIVPRHGIPLRFIPSVGMPDRKYSPAMAVFLLTLLAGAFKAFFILLRWRPQLIVATGGYVSAPVLLAARLLRRPILVHEQNAFPGLVNRTFGKLAGRVCVTFKETLVYFQHNGVLVGYPVRREILALREPASDEQKRQWKRDLGVDPDRRVILATGGSLGARSLNRAVAALAPKLAADAALRRSVFVMHGVGRYADAHYHAADDVAARLAAGGFREDDGRDFYRREEYLYDIDKWLRVADIIICRAGAGSLAETAAVGAPAVVIPKSGLPGDHQVKNAETMAAAGACLVIQERRVVERGESVDAVDDERLLAAIRELLSAPPERRAAMRAAAAGFVVPDCLERIEAQARALVAGPKPQSEKATRRRTFLVDPQGRRTEALYDKSRVGSGRWDDVRLALPGLAPGHFWLKRTARMVNGRVEETWTVIPRESLRLRHADGAIEAVNGPTALAEDDRLVLPDGTEFSLAFEWVTVTREKATKGVVENVFSQGLGTFMAKGLGFVREAFLGRFFGAGSIMDVFAVALSIANLMREVVAEMALENAFLPSFLLFYHRSDDKRPAWRLAWQVFNFFFVLSSAFTALAILTCPWWIHLVARFNDPALIAQTVAMTRLMFPFLILMSVSAFLGTLLQAFDRFGPNAFSPVLYSLGLIFIVPILEPLFGLYALGVGVLVGGALQIVYQMFFLLRRGLREKIAWNAYQPRLHGEPGVRKVAALAGPVFIDATINKISGIVDKVLATPLIAGSVSALYFSRLLVVFPFSVLAMSVSRVFLRDLSDVAAESDAKEYSAMLRRGIDATLMLMIPTTAMLIALATPLVRFIFEGGKFTAVGTSMTSLALVCYAIGLLGWSLTSLYSRVFSSQLDTRTSMLTNAGSLVVYLVFAVVLVRTPLRHAGLALATSLMFAFNTVWRHRIIARRLAADGAPIGMRQFAPTFGKTIAASVVMVLVMQLAFVAPRDGAGFVAKAWAFLAPAGLGLFIFLMFAYLLRTDPLIDFLNYFAARYGLGRPFGNPPLRLPEGNGNVRALSAAALLAEAQRRPFDDAELAIVRERLATYLSHDDWWVRNFGVKLIGALKMADQLDVLVDAVAAPIERRPWLLRQWLGSRRDAGFVRRNALTALTDVGVFDERVRRAILAGLDDPYYEVRQFALRTAVSFREQLRGDAACLAGVARCLRDRHFEVAPAAIAAWAELADAPHAIDELFWLLDDPRWPVRAAAATGCRRLHDRGLAPDRAALRRALQRTLLTAEMVEPVSPLKTAVKRAIAGLTEEG
jgi:murein biosynthesis integral membrane protein MurJ/undecaprenyldiphospho-muramoylpentapeptide beta-N-acetylglucosaminyltransferase